MYNDKKFCEFCGKQIHIEAVLCPNCGRQIEKLKTDENKLNPQIIINNSNTINDTQQKRECDKWISFLLCFFLGYIGGHKFYEGKIGLGILYIFTVGLFGIGWFIDLIIIICKPNPYYV